LARGDSALGMIGREIPGPIDEFAEFASRVRTYLRGGTVDLDGKPSRLTWIPEGLPPVPVDIAATGPNALAMAAGIADRVSFAVGTDPERVAWALATARAGAVAAGRDPDEVEYGMYCNVAVAADAAAVPEAAQAMCNPIAYSAHFSAMKETRVADHPPALRRVSEPLRRAFVYREGTPASCVDPEFARWWGAVGTAAEVVDKLGTALDMGLSHVYLLNGTTADKAFSQASLERLAGEVVPALRAARPAALTPS
ncbi:LLM class flavin-dependent oxidoreductase, partial [Pseudonocardia pini]|uniref:LLM class flavin-dependent oxidoreductase n=1 Tax=Pseudonocardia pini TaxID=2758030 RepID=UPI0015F0B6D3